MLFWNFPPLLTHTGECCCPHFEGEKINAEQAPNPVFVLPVTPPNQNAAWWVVGCYVELNPAPQ